MLQSDMRLCTPGDVTNASVEDHETIDNEYYAVVNREYEEPESDS
jgi:hypothetical protein